jgi:hypothetical protein
MSDRAACHVSVTPAVASIARRQVSGDKSTNRLSCKNSKIRDSGAASAIRANGQGALQAHDIRTRTAGPGMGNIARAGIANRAGAALFLRVHADGHPSSAVRGTHILVPALRRGWTDDVYRPSRRAASLLLPVVASVTCPACSSENPAGFRFCGFCATPGKSTPEISGSLSGWPMS